jgi:DnaJ-class molecular chaperone
VAGETNDNEEQAEATHQPRECMPCRGTGQLISSLGGTPSKIACPWCEGGGVRLTEVNAQARWPTEQESGAEPAAGSEPAA